MKICCYATDPHPGLDLLKKTCPDLVMLPKVCEWDWYFYPKWEAFRKYLSFHSSPSEIVMIVDAYDVLMLNLYAIPGQVEIMSSIVLGNRDIVFNAEKGCYPVSELKSEYPISGSPWNYLNAGCAVGRVGAWQYHLDIVLPKMRSAMDQEVWTRHFLANQDKIGLDNNCDLFQSYAFIDPDDYEYQEVFIRNKVTGSYPAVWHGNGRTPMTDLHPYILPCGT